MFNPYVIEGPAVISFSGGRTSGYMLRRVLDEGLRPDVHVIFANTGKERIETLEFIRDVEEHWAVPIRWIERAVGGVVVEAGFLGGSRDSGVPFADLITKRKMLPNPAMRFCTQELKIRPMRDWMMAQGYTHWTNVVGIRADEPRRVAKMRAQDEARSERWDIALPLADAGVTVSDVMGFWGAQPFDLRLRSDEGNCDMCFLKSMGKITNLVRERPDLANWWAVQEERVQAEQSGRWKHNTTTAQFRLDRPSYRMLLAQPDLFKDAMTDDLIECYCTD